MKTVRFSDHSIGGNTAWRGEDQDQAEESLLRDDNPPISLFFQVRVHAYTLRRRRRFSISKIHSRQHRKDM